MDDLNSDMLLHVIQYLAVPDSGRLAATSKRFLFVVRSFQKLRGPQLVASTSRIPQVRTRQRTFPEVCRDAVQQLQSKPNLALFFGKANYGTTPPEAQLHEYLPPNTIQLGVNAPSIQCCVSSEVECSSHYSLMLGSFPNVTIIPFLLDENEQIEMRQVLEENDKRSFDCKVCMIFACGEGLCYSKLESTIQLVQSKYPLAVIVGGVCSTGFIPCSRTELMSISALNEMMLEFGKPRTVNSLEEQRMLEQDMKEMMQGYQYFAQTVEEGIFGIMMGGDVPVRSVVSRGMHSMTSKGPPRPETSFWVKEAQFLRFGDDGYIFPDSSAPPYHQISSIEDRSTGKVYTYMEMMRQFGRTSLVGLRDPDEDGFTLCNVHQLSSMVDFFLLFDQSLGNESLQGKNMDLLEINGDACLQDMDLRMQQLQDALKDEELLGALMISCNGRGPEASHLIREEMADAKRFRKAFPNVPCLGFYAGGEIGPLAQAARQDVFQFGKVGERENLELLCESSCNEVLVTLIQNGHPTSQAALQGFTVVFAAFVVPKINFSTFYIDDGEESVNVFATDYFSRDK
jgi:small ligand-binding sensory domain FIST